MRKGLAEPMGPGRCSREYSAERPGRWNSIAREQEGYDVGGDSGILGRRKLCKQKTQMEIEDSDPRKDQWPLPLAGRWLQELLTPLENGQSVTSEACSWPGLTHLTGFHSGFHFLWSMVLLVPTGRVHLVCWLAILVTENDRRQTY